MSHEINQESVALVIVGVAAAATLLHLFRKYLAAPLARRFLKMGKVKWAVKVKSQAREPGCDGCD